MSVTVAVLGTVSPVEVPADCCANGGERIYDLGAMRVLSEKGRVGKRDSRRARLKG